MYLSWPAHGANWRYKPSGGERQAGGHYETTLWSSNENQRFDLTADFNQTKDGDSADDEESLFSS